ncbi:MAG: hypothetical protein HC897_16540 [Thermoanaerobaculia bacterium]|nr:hypothetical protein [Thermoanaerobaculia bacterium]
MMLQKIVVKWVALAAVSTLFAGIALAHPLGLTRGEHLGRVHLEVVPPRLSAEPRSRR